MEEGACESQQGDRRRRDTRVERTAWAKVWRPKGCLETVRTE